MRSSVVKKRPHRTNQQNKLVQEAIKATLSKKGVVVSRATTVKDICAAANYNFSVELDLPTCKTS
jgi:hypothetical protein